MANIFVFQFATFRPQSTTNLDAGLDGKIKTALNPISANQICEFGSSQSL